MRGYYSLVCKPGSRLKNSLTSNSSKQQSQNSNPGLSDSKPFVPKIIDSLVFTDHVSGGKSGNSVDGEVPLVDFVAFHSMKFVKGVAVDVNNLWNPFHGLKVVRESSVRQWWFYLLKTYTLNVLWKSPCTWLSCAKRWFLFYWCLIDFFVNR